MKFRIRHRIFLCAAALCLSGAAFAQAWPTKPLKMIVPFPPGGAVDILGRAISQKLSDATGQPVVVDNRAGAGGAVGSEAAAKSPNDGYTLLMGSTSTISINPALVSKPTYDPQHDFTPVSQVAFVPHMLVASMAVPVANLREFIAYAKANPGKLNYASAGNGTPHHIAAEMFKQLAGVEMVHVPYKGTGPAINDLLAGQISFMSVEVLAALPHVRAGKLRALGMATANRSEVAPEIPTVAEAGLPGFEVTAWYGVFAPAGSPPAAVQRVAAEVAKAVREADFRERLANLGATPVGSNPEEFAKFLRVENVRWANAVKASGAKLD
jgi:tripartite-type tricarboxylate transporter receptor subunit TctC